MTQRASAALLEALALLRAPRGPRPSPQQPLPDGMSLLMRLVAGEEEASSLAREATGETAQTLREAATFYIQQVCFAPGGTSYRILGVEADASDERIREHYRWLARWLHPDRNPDPWEVVFAERVGQAWQDLRTADRRQRYDDSLHAVDDWNVVETAQPIPRPPESRSRRSSSTAPRTAGRDLRWVPSAVVAALGATALGLVVLFYASRPRPPSTSPSPQALAVAEPIAVPEKITSIAAPDLPSVPTPESLPAAPVSMQVADVLASPPPAFPEPAMAPQAIVSAPRIPPTTAAAPAAPRAAPRPREAIPTTKVATASAIPPKPVKSSTPRAAIAAAPSNPPAGSAEPAAPNPPAPAATMTSRDANLLLGNFSRAYKEGDLHGMRALFAADAQGPRGGLDSILADYDQVFSDTRKRSLDVRNVNWFQSGDTLTIVASFEAIVFSERTGRPRRSHGDLRLDLRRQGQQWQIYRMKHDEDPG